MCKPASRKQKPEKIKTVTHPSMNIAVSIKFLAQSLRLTNGCSADVFQFKKLKDIILE